VSTTYHSSRAGFDNGQKLLAILSTSVSEDVAGWDHAQQGRVSEKGMIVGTDLMTQSKRQNLASSREGT
jgi:hypothetical protein